MASNKFRIKTIGNKIISNQIIEEKPANIPISVDTETKINIRWNGVKEFDEFFDGFNSEVLLMHTTESNLNKIFRKFEQLIENYDCLIKQMTQNYLQKECVDILENAKQFVLKKLKERNTAKKRQKLIESDETYVKPTNVGFSLKWQSKKTCGSEMVDHKLVQSTYQYVSISDTLKSLFNFVTVILISI